MLLNRQLRAKYELVNMNLHLSERFKHSIDSFINNIIGRCILSILFRLATASVSALMIVVLILCISVIDMSPAMNLFKQKRQKIASRLVSEENSLTQVTKEQCLFLLTELLFLLTGP